MKYLIAIVIVIILGAGVSLVGCDDPYLNPEISTALTEKLQYEELKKQNEIYERIAKSLERIAECQTK
jgi:hypothetical protein